MSDDNHEGIPGGEDSINQVDDNGPDDKSLAPEPPPFSPKQPKSPSSSSAGLKNSALGSNPPLEDSSGQTTSEAAPLTSKEQPKYPSRSSTDPRSVPDGSNPLFKDNSGQTKSKAVPLTSKEQPNYPSRSSTDPRNVPVGSDFSLRRGPGATKSTGQPLSSQIQSENLSRPSTYSRNSSVGRNSSFSRDSGLTTSGGIASASREKPKNLSRSSKDSERPSNGSVSPPLSADSTQTKSEGPDLIGLDSRPPTRNEDKAPTAFADLGQIDAAGSSLTSGNIGTRSVEKPSSVGSERTSPSKSSHSKTLGSLAFGGGEEVDRTEQQPYFVRLRRRVEIWSQAAWQAIAQFSLTQWARIRAAVADYYKSILVPSLKRLHKLYGWFINLVPFRAIARFMLILWTFSVTVRYIYFSIWSLGDITVILWRCVFSFISYFNNDSRCLLMGRSGLLYEPDSRSDCLRRTFVDTFWGLLSGAFYFIPSRDTRQWVWDEAPLRLAGHILKWSWDLVYNIILKPWPYDDTSHFKLQPPRISESIESDIYPIIDPIVFPPYPTPSLNHNPDDTISATNYAAAYVPRFTSPKPASWVPDLYSLSVGVILTYLVFLILSRIAYNNPRQWERIRSRSLSLSSSSGNSSSAVSPTSPFVRPASARSIRHGGDDGFAPEGYTEMPEREIAAPRGRKRSVKAGAGTGTGTGTIGRPSKGGAVARRTRSRSRGA